MFPFRERIDVESYIPSTENMQVVLAGSWWSDFLLKVILSQDFGLQFRLKKSVKPPGLFFDSHRVECVH